MKIAGILTIGDELLQGFTINSNAAKISMILTKRNISVKIHLTVPDNIEKIKEKIDKFISKDYDFVIITGGLGPTHDDVTKKALLELFTSKLKFYKSWDLKLQERYRKIKLKPKISKCQSEILDNSVPLENNNGTALGMSIISKKSNIIVLPGVPIEMEDMLLNYLNSNDIKEVNDNIVTINTTGIHETKLSSMIYKIINDNKIDFSFSFLPSESGVKIRISSITDKIEDEILIGDILFLNKDNRIINIKNKIKSIVSDYAYSEGNITLEETVANLLIKNKYNLSIAESCTGGLISKSLTDIPDASLFFNGSVVAYNNKIKQNFLNIQKNIIEEKGAVSSEVSKLMAINIANKFSSNIGISCTGISGPKGGTLKKPVGLVYISIYFLEKIITKKFIFVADRNLHRIKTKQASLYMLWKLLIN